MLNEQIQRCAQQSLADRKEAQRDFREALLDTRLIAERTRWIFQGCYGWGATDRALSIREMKCGNRVAAIAQLLAVLDWNCPGREAAAAWNSLDERDQLAVNAAILHAMNAADETISKADRA